MKKYPLVNENDLPWKKSTGWPIAHLFFFGIMLILYVLFDAFIAPFLPLWMQ